MFVGCFNIDEESWLYTVSNGWFFLVWGGVYLSIYRRKGPPNFLSAKLYVILDLPPTTMKNRTCIHHDILWTTKSLLEVFA